MSKIDVNETHEMQGEEKKYTPITMIQIMATDGSITSKPLAEYDWLFEEEKETSLTECAESLFYHAQIVPVDEFEFATGQEGHAEDIICLITGVPLPDHPQLTKYRIKLIV